MNPRRAACFLAVLLMACAPLALGQGTYTQIDVPGATTTIVDGINNAGDMVGEYDDSAGVHGFLLSGAIFIAINNPAGNTVAYGINDVGQIVGHNASGAFLYDIGTQTFTSIACPGAPEIQTISANSINNTGMIVGTCQSLVSNNYIGFQSNGTTFRKITAPGYASSHANGINNSGEVVGWAYTSNGTYIESSFVFKQGKFKFFNSQIGTYAEASGVNDSNEIVGTDLTDGAPYYAGFVYQDKTFQRLRFPAAIYTHATGINNSGQVVGYFYDSSNNIHGFTWTPPADAAKK